MHLYQNRKAQNMPVVAGRFVQLSIQIKRDLIQRPNTAASLEKANANRPNNRAILEQNLN